MNKEIFDNGSNTPVPPPRKKKHSPNNRSATLPASSASSSEKVIKNGFKDIFGDANDTASKLDMSNAEVQPKKSTRRIDRLLSEPSEPGQSTNDTDEIEKLAASSDKKMFFLMNMLHDQINKRDEMASFENNEIRVDEFNVITKKKPKKLSHDGQVQVDPPKKPDRDLSRYQKSLSVADVSSSSEEPVNLESLCKKLTVEDDVSTAPPQQRKSGAHNLTPLAMENDKKSKQNRPPKLNITITKPDESKNVPQTAPILTEVIVDEMMKKAYGLHNYHPEDFTLHSVDDGSNLVAPTSKLSVRKISVGRRISNCSTPSLDNDPTSPEVLSVDSPRTPPLRSPTLTAFKSAGMADFLEEIYKKNPKIMDEFQSYLEISVEKNAAVNVTEELKKVDEEKNVELTSKDEDDTQKPQEDVDEKSQSSGDDFDDDEDEINSDEQQETITEIAMIPRNKFPKYHSARRESIEDVDNWFTRHLDIEEKKSNYENIPDSPPVTSTYDTQKTFPFGKAVTNRRGSVSDEFFSDLPPVFTSNEGAIAEEENWNSENKIPKSLYRSNLSYRCLFNQ